MAHMVCTPQAIESRPEAISLRPAGLLSNASAAAASAAEAARAAAQAATAAANAADAAVDAINSLAPSMARKPQTKAAKPISSPTTPHLLEHHEEAGTSTAFISPTGKTLVDLIGTLEIQVSVDSNGDYARGLASKIAGLDFPVTSTNEINLAESIDAGRSFSRDALVAGARVDQAKAQQGQSLALLLPSINFRRASGNAISDPTLNRDQSAKQLPRNDYSLSIIQPIVNLPNFFDYRRRELVTQAREENRRAADGDAYLQSVSAYLSLVSTRVQAEMAYSFEKQLKELLVYIEKRADAGVSSSSDKSRVSARAQAAISTRIELESAHTAAGVDYVRVTNLAPRVVRIPEIEDLGALLIPSSLEQAIEIALGSNPDIAALISESRAANLESKAAKFKYLPRLDFELSMNQTYGAGGDPSSMGQSDKKAMLILNWNLFSGGADARATDERKARHRELQYRLDDQRRRIIQALSAQYANLTATRNRIVFGYLELDSIAEAGEAMSKRKLTGNQSLLDLLDVYERYYQTRIRLVDLHIQEMNAVAQIVRQIQATPSNEFTPTSNPNQKTTPTGQPTVLNKQSAPTTFTPSNADLVLPETKRPIQEVTPYPTLTTPARATQEYGTDTNEAENQQ